MILTIVILSVLLCISIGLNIYFGIRLILFLDKIDSYQKWMNEIELSINNTYQKLKLIDDRQLFEKDDDVGFVFTNIVKLIEKLKSQL